MTETVRESSPRSTQDEPERALPPAATPAGDAEELAPPAVRPGKAAWQRFLRYRLALPATIVLVLLVLAAFAGPLVWTVDPPLLLRWWMRPGAAWMVTTNHPALALRDRRRPRRRTPARMRP